ncbi:MAG: lamin tail domain-containing protein, partial [Caldilineaceae bacterium]|nr:lamin tail domain-containing protein [Caldilineaceae bacterium]
MNTQQQTSNLSLFTILVSGLLFCGFILFSAHAYAGSLAGASTSLIINEVDADTPGDDTAEFVELFDGGSGNTSLTGYTLVLFNGSNDQSYLAIDLDGHSTDANGYFVIGNSAIASAVITFANGAMQQGPDAVALYAADATNFPNRTALTTVNLVDALVYDTNDADDAELLTLLNAGQPQVNEGGA